MTADLTNPIFNDEDAAWTHFEAIRWPDGRACYHCGVVGQSEAAKGKTTRRGLYNCRACRKPFTGTMGTVYEKSHIPMHKWLLATHLMASSKKGMSAHQLYRMLGFGSYRTAWFMAHRIREAMKPEPHAEPMGGAGTPVEVDETFIGHDILNPPAKDEKRSIHNMNKVLSLVDRSTGEARSFVVKDLRMATIAPIIQANVAREAWLMTDEATRYTALGWNFSAHGVVNHGAEEYVSKDNPIVHTNTVEGFYSVFKRGMRGVYQHCASRHLHRYVVEFDFRYTNRTAVGVDDKWTGAVIIAHPRDEGAKAVRAIDHIREATAVPENNRGDNVAADSRFDQVCDLCRRPARRFALKVRLAKKSVGDARLKLRDFDAADVAVATRWRGKVFPKQKRVEVDHIRGRHFFLPQTGKIMRVHAGRV